MKPPATGGLRFLLAGAITLPLLFGGVASGQQAAAPAAPEEAAGAGNYITEEQVASGRSAYEQRCSGCHGQDMVASIAAYPSAWLFFSYASTAMPADAPGSLPPQQYADIVAYLLSENGHPATGTKPLPPDQAVLETIDPDAPPAADDDVAPATDDPASGAAPAASEPAAPSEAAAPVEEDASASGGEAGYITEEQVASGRSAYEQRCSGCHGQDMIASIAAYPSAWLFFSYASTAMPADAPGSLPRQQYADIVAYLLSENGHAATGAEPLPPDQAVLETITPSAPAGAEAEDEVPAEETPE